MKICPKCGESAECLVPGQPLVCGCNNPNAGTPVHQPSNVTPIPTPKQSSTVPCPDCHGVMQRRTGPYSVFYGCSNFPKCRTKMNQYEYNAMLTGNVRDVSKW